MQLRPSKRREYFNLPNYLTMGRILLVPFVAWLLVFISPEKKTETNFFLGLMASIVFLIAAISDLVDGYYARKYQINSVFGKYFDPLADKLMNLTVMIMLIPLGRIEAWIVTLFLAREITITALRGVASSEGLTIAADRWGKSKTFLQNLALILLMLYYPLWGIDITFWAYWTLIFALFMAIASGFGYVWKFSQAILKSYHT